MPQEKNLEIERKYIIEKPEISRMMSELSYTASDIVQIYLLSPAGVTRRIRSRAYPDGTRYYETVKIRIDKMSSDEQEREIDHTEFEELSRLADPASRPIIKTRHTFDYLGQTFEIDVYPEWESSCVMETELPTRETRVEFPDFIRVIKEVTGDKRYSNASMSRSFPKELK